MAAAHHRSIVERVEYPDYDLIDIEYPVTFLLHYEEPSQISRRDFYRDEEPRDDYNQEYRGRTRE